MIKTMNPVNAADDDGPGTPNPPPPPCPKCGRSPCVCKKEQ